MPKWTSDQELAINVRNKNILVSAAAGSGKTAVLVERIITMLLDNEHPVDIDRIVVVTFTNAAAAQMKEKIYNRIKEQLAKEPQNERLLKALPLVHKAYITTIDSFCLDIVKNNFAQINIDPVFRIADNGELGLIKTEAYEEMMEEYFTLKEKDFLEFVETFTVKPNSDTIEEVILKIYNISRSFPWPEEWLDSCTQVYNVNDKKEFLSKPYMVAISEKIKGIAKQMLIEIDEELPAFENAVKRTSNTETTQNGLKSLRSTAEFILNNDFEEYYKINMDFQLAKGKANAAEANGRKVVSKYKNLLNDMKDTYLKFNVDDEVEKMKWSYRQVNMLVKLTKDFSQRVALKKREKSIIDFSDMEHMALDILVKRENGQKLYTKVADEFAQNFEEILVDEYQDSNNVQEEILYAISKERIGAGYNMFMVGDVKQSIYKFRMARPELFMEKYNRYDSYMDNKASMNVKIDLSKNFRSRENILETTNSIFEDIMNGAVGGIKYDSAAKLYLGRETKDHEYNDRFATDIVVLERKKSSEKNEEADEAEEYMAIEKQAAQAAAMINEMVDNPDYTIFDDKLGKNRKIEFRDIVILLRSASKNADAVIDILNGSNIKAFYNSDTGYFSAREIKEVLNYLAVIDNPRQDIALAGTMLSYFGGYDTNELASIKAFSETKSLYDSLTEYAQNGTNADLSSKTTSFLEEIDAKRKSLAFIPVSELVSQIIYDTGYYTYMEALTEPKIRRANLDIFSQKAKVYEKTSYVGLFNFLRYIEKLKKYDVDYSNATVIGEKDNIVRIMTIHKSKGLEFPVVFVMGMQKGHNKMDLNPVFVADPDMGIALDYIDISKRLKKKSLYKNLVKQKMKEDIIAEEMRILYVALTRAKEKLILIGDASDLKKKSEKWQKQYEDDYCSDTLIKMNSFLEMVMPTVLNKANQYVKFSTLENVIINIEETRTENVILPHNYIDISYGYECDTRIKSKYSVSELKHKSMEDVGYIYEKKERQKKLPRFMDKDEHKKLGSDRGTAYHKVMELLDYSKVATLEEVKEQMQNLKIKDIDLVNPEDIYSFCITSVGKRIKEAYANDNLFREQQFVLGIPARNIIHEDSDELILIQGIIDMFFVENGQAVIIDYKTDKIKDKLNYSKELTDKYSEQLKQYAAAVMQITGICVKECYIYSFEMNNFVNIPTIT